MKVTIEKSTANGTVKAPPSKSDAHRLLICAGLSKGISTIGNISLSEDISATLDCLSSLGAKIKIDGDTVTVDGTETGTSTERYLNCRESGSTLRFFIPICMLSDKETTLSGSERLFARPLDIYEKIAKEQNLVFNKESGKLTVKGVLKGTDFTVRGNVSSQFISGLLFSMPLLENDSRIHILPPVESQPYIEMTLSTMRKFGIECYFENDETLFVKGNQAYIPQKLSAEGDWSNAAFLDGFNLVGGDVVATGLSADSLQGDKIYRQYFEMIKNGRPTLDISDCPDLGPVLMALAAANNGAVLTGTKRLKIKESDRGEAMKQELSKFSIDVKVSDNEIVVESGLRKPSQILCSHNDHRIVMSLTILLSLTGGEISGAEAVRKSFPDFFEKIGRLGIIRSEE